MISYVYTVKPLLTDPPKSGLPPKSGQMACPQCVHYSEGLLYSACKYQVGNVVKTLPVLSIHIALLDPAEQISLFINSIVIVNPIQFQLMLTSNPRET